MAATKTEAQAIALGQAGLDALPEHVVRITRPDGSPLSRVQLQVFIASHPELMVRLCSKSSCTAHVLTSSYPCKQGPHTRRGGGGAGTTQSPIDIHIANQKAVDKDEVKIIGHLRARYGEVVKCPSAPLSRWARLATAWKIVWTGTVVRAAPIEVEVPGGTLPAYITVTLIFFLFVRQPPPIFLCVAWLVARRRHAADAAAAGPGDGTAIGKPPHLNLPPVIRVCGGWLLCGALVGGYPSHHVSRSRTDAGGDRWW